MGLKDTIAQWGPQAMFDAWALGTMTLRMDHMVPQTFMPVLRLVSGDPVGVDEAYAQVLGQREPLGRFDSPRERWRKEYGRFVRELEWVSQQLKKHLAEPEYKALVSGTIAREINDWIGFVKPKFADLYAGKSGAPNAAPKKASAAAKAFERRITAFVTDHMFGSFNAVNFMVGPLEMRELDVKNGKMEAYIPECVLHTVTGGRTPNEEACVVSCKAGTEAAFGDDSPLKITLEPHLPGLACTMRAEWDPALLREGKGPRSVERFVPEKALLRKALKVQAPSPN